MAPEEELEKARAAFRDFMYRAIHDLHQPLRAITTSAEMLEGIYADSTDQRATKCLHFIREGTDQMARLLRDIAGYCDGEGLELHPAQINLTAVLTQVQQQMAEGLAKSGAIIRHDALPAVTCDFYAMATVFRHLIDNACKFRGAETPSIHFASTRQGEEWIISVRDNGLGFKPEYAAGLFQPFKRLHGKEYPGNGLGLALAKRILEQHGGRIWVVSAPGQGSTFSFSLPVD